MKRLYRSRKDAMIAGVCGGLAEYLGIDSALVRIIFAAAMIAGGVGVLAYFLAWIIIPEMKTEGSDYNTADSTYNERRQPELSGDRVRMMIGFGFIAMGVLFFINKLFPQFTFDIFWPAILIMVGALILLKGKGES